MKIAGYIKTSLIEWPGKISSVIFTQGCNFKCPFCHNRDLVLEQGFSRIEEKQILADLANRRKWVDAVVVTGGEPTLQTDLSRFLSRLKQMGFLTMIHTNGMRPETIASLLSCYLVDYVCMDLKGDLENYEKFCNVKYPLQGKQMSNVKTSMELIVKSGIEYEFRTTVVPGLHNLENLKRLARELRTTANRLQPACRQGRTTVAVNSSQKAVSGPKWFLQQFRPMNTLDKKYLKVKPFSKEEMEAFQKELQKIIPQTLLRGV